ncbi:YciK family oxidoreductase [Salinicola endophyticus]|uniref:YciK family oxidoreductase n=1 Tax=Salinicola endophyticus TaxID=1949083 RepID=A0ABY8FJE4_9GAMM|nr:YciK family oxidoreductase [Salinicola endophyticus]WFF42933.1 YciK family oxidoreductase [Salinicola endophyticus]
MPCQSDYQPPVDLLAGKVILVTGASAGIGRAAAMAYARHGATVVLLGRSLSRLETVYDAIEAAKAPQPAIFPLNLESATAQDFGVVAAKLEQAFGRLDGLLHNASMLGERKSVAASDLEVWARVMQVNFTASLGLTQALLPLLEASTNASVVFTSSSVGRRGRAEWGAYSTSKFATEGLMQILADEYRDLTLRFNSINPGGTRTAMRRAAYPQEDPQRVPTPESIMPTYLWLMGRDSRGTTGEAFDAQPPRQ